MAQAARREAARAEKKALRKIGRDPVCVEKITCGAVAQAARRAAARAEKSPHVCRETTGYLSVGTQNSKVSQRPDNRLVEAGEPLQILAPVLYELSDQPVVLVAAS